METTTLARAPGLLGRARELVAELSEVGFEAPEGPQAGVDLLREVEVLARQVRSLQLQALDVVDGTEVWRRDGHRSVRPMAAIAGRLSGPEELRRARCARALRELPEVAAARRAGRIGACQAERISRTWANPRVRAAFRELDAEVAAYAARAAYWELDAMLRNWEAMADEDGAADRGAANHEGRDARCDQRDDGGWSGEWRCGSLDGAQLRAILDAFTRAELEADRDAARPPTVASPSSTDSSIAPTPSAGSTPWPASSRSPPTRGPPSTAARPSRPSW